MSLDGEYTVTRSINYKFDDYGNTYDQASVQYYRDQMVKVKDGIVYITASREPITTGRRRDYKHDPAGTDYSVKTQPPFKPKHEFGKYGWWSGALSSRNANGADLKSGIGLDKGTYYPLYSRIEIKLRFHTFSAHGWRYGFVIVMVQVPLK